jgi:hypothetical protein
MNGFEGDRSHPAQRGGSKGGQGLEGDRSIQHRGRAPKGDRSIRRSEGRQTAKGTGPIRRSEGHSGGGQVPSDAAGAFRRGQVSSDAARGGGFEGDRSHPRPREVPKWDRSRLTRRWCGEGFLENRSLQSRRGGFQKEQVKNGRSDRV